MKRVTLPIPALIILFIIAAAAAFGAQALYQRILADDTDTSAGTVIDASTMPAFPTPDVSGLCEGIGQFARKIKVAEDYYRQHIAGRTYSQITQLERDTYVNLVWEANAVPIPLPPFSPTADAERLYDLIRDYQEAADRYATGVFTNNTSITSIAADKQRALIREKDAYWPRVCGWLSPPIW